MQITWVSVLFKVNYIVDGRVKAKKIVDIKHLYNINSFLCNLQVFMYIISLSLSTKIKTKSTSF